MIDTGSSCSVIPVDSNSRDHLQDYLSAVNGSSVPTFGCKNITIDLQGCGVGVGVGVGVGRSRRFSEGVGVGIGVGLSSRLGVGVGVGIFYPTPTPHVHFLYVFVMLAAQLTRPRAPVECSTVIFLREPCRVSRDTACDS